MAKVGRVALALLIGLSATVSALAQGYPSKPVNLIVGFPPGSVPDVIARLLSPGLNAIWSQPLVMEYRLGAAGTIAAGAVAKSPADGYTLLVHGAYAVNAAFSYNLPYDPLNDLVAVAPLARQPFVLIARAASDLKTLTELIAAAKAMPGRLNYGSPGVGSYPHLGGKKLGLAAGIDVVHVPYKGPAEVVGDLLGGRIDFAYSPVAIALPHIRDGKLRALAVSDVERSRLLPDVPTAAEAGISGCEFVLSIGIWAPARTPSEVVAKVSKDVSRVLALPDVRDALTKAGAEPMSMSPAEFARYVRREIEDLKRTVKAAGIAPQ